MPVELPILLLSDVWGTLRLLETICGLVVHLQVMEMGRRYFACLALFLYSFPNPSLL